ncbi:MAG: TetR/AcrR family transcriptional regulator [Thermomicrobiales bacterium]
MSRPSSARERILVAAERLTLERGFAATSIDAILDVAEASKGAFFHHFSSKDALGLALVERYAKADAEVLETFMSQAEALHDDPSGQLVAFVRSLATSARASDHAPVGCLFVTFIYERGPRGGEIDRVIQRSIEHWRERILTRLLSAADIHGIGEHVELQSLADHVFVVAEGGFILARAMDDRQLLAAQLDHLANYLELLFCSKGGA